MNKAYLKKESQEKPHSKMTRKELVHEKKETPLHEKIEHQGKKLAKALRSKIKYNA